MASGRSEESRWGEQLVGGKQVGLHPYTKNKKVMLFIEVHTYMFIYIIHEHLMFFVPMSQTHHDGLNSL